MSPSLITVLCAGKTVVITGAGQGLGQAAAVAFAAGGAKCIAIVDSSCTSDTIERASPGCYRSWKNRTGAVFLLSYP